MAEDNQYCLPHLLRELLKVDEHNRGAEWQAFARTASPVDRDGIRLRKRHDFTPERYASRIGINFIGGSAPGRRDIRGCRREASGPSSQHAS